MRAIIIDDAACKALVDQLKLEALEIDPTLIVSGNPRTEMTAGDMHRRFHYRVVQRLQAQGWKAYP